MSNSELTADDARRMASRSGNKYVAEFEGLIERAAKDGKRGVLLCYTDCNADWHNPAVLTEPIAMADLNANTAIDENMVGTLKVGGDAPTVCV